MGGIEDLNSAATVVRIAAEGEDQQLTPKAATKQVDAESVAETKEPSPAGAEITVEDTPTGRKNGGGQPSPAGMIRGFQPTGDFNQFALLGRIEVTDEQTPMSREKLFSVLTSRIRILLSRQNISNDPSIALFMSGSSLYPSLHTSGIETPSTLTEAAPSTAGATDGESTVDAESTAATGGTSHQPSEPSTAGSTLVATSSSIISIPSFHADRPEDVSIDVDSLLRHPSLAALKGIDAEMVLDAANAVGSQLIRVDRERRRLHPVMRVPRCTLILRELYINAEELKNLLLDCPQLKNRGEQAIREIREEAVASNTHWFVTLETEIQATEVALWLRSQTHKGNSIRVAVKSESEFQSFISRQQPDYSMMGAFVPALMPPMMVPPSGPGSYCGFRGGRGRRGRSFMGRSSWQMHDPNLNRKDDNRQPRVSVDGKTSAAQQGPGGPGARRGGRRNAYGRGRAQSRGDNATGRRNNRKTDWSQNKISAPGNQIPPVDPIDFPPLAASAKISTADYGYNRAFRRYSPETMRRIKAAMQQNHN